MTVKQQVLSKQKTEDEILMDKILLDIDELDSFGQK
jgi:hypothetical protein